MKSPVLLLPPFSLLLVEDDKLAREMVARTHSEFSRALQNNDVKERFVKLGLDTVGSSSEHLAKYLQEEVAKWAGVIRKTGISAK